MAAAKNGGHHVWRRFAVIARPYWLSEEKWKARGLLVLAILLLLGQTAFNVLLNEQTGEFTSALAARDADRFWLSIRQCIAIVVVAVPIYALYYYVRDTLGIFWRRWLTNRFLDRYFADRAYYALNAAGTIDNPDQRISEDINAFTQQSLYFLMIALGAVIQLAAFTGVLWSISRELVWFLIFYALVGTTVTVAVFGRVLIGINFLQLRREADFRFSLVRIREHAEAIALHRGEEQESFQAKQFFGAAFANYRKLLRAQLNLNLFQYAYSFLTIVLPSAIIATRVISGELEVGRAVQAAGAFAAILGAVAVIVDHFEGLSRFAAGIDRLGTFSRALAGKEAPRPDSGGQIESAWGPHLALEHLTLLTPGRERTLIVDLSVSAEPGQGLMIVGDSGGGKSSLLRAIAGLWIAGAGRIVRPGPEETMFLPQQPYMVLGSLRSQLLYPGRARPVSDQELLRLLERVNLGDLARRFGGLDAELDWGKVLSIGEQQRLAFARVLLCRPRYVMLDEATSALDRANEDHLYRELAATSTTPVSVSHHAALLKFHRQVLELAGNGQWRLHLAADYRFH
ncbi:MAG: ABC transporter ATP-binding protein/permease [Burkholderiales bacterium]|nr:ABC transporter ATP-binding protein/permease [Burkholderiales bacterium]HMM50290.1 ABC transporter ATP-binding protein/permease [Burkholderiaceae bacterium]